jgi:hypothetical protein
LWRTDGTAAGTVATWTSPRSGDLPGNFTVAGGKLFFVAHPWVTGDGTARRLYTADLDGANARQVNLPSPGAFEPRIVAGLVAVGGRVLFSGHNAGGTWIFSSDGTDAGTIPLAGGWEGIYSNSVSAPADAAPGRAGVRDGV